MQLLRSDRGFVTVREASEMFARFVADGMGAEPVCLYSNGIVSKASEMSLRRDTLVVPGSPCENTKEHVVLVIR